MFWLYAWDCLWISVVDFFADCVSWYFRRPGILVLINDADWELEGQEAYELQAGDEVVFVSTLHGG